MYALLSAVPAVTLGLYLYLGAPAIIEAQQLLEAHNKRDVNAMLAAVETNLQTNPDDAEGWHALGQSYLALQRIGEAEVALAKAVKLSPKEARYLSQYAEALALTNNDNLEGRPLELVNEALELNHEDAKGLELAGLAAYKRQDWAQAAHFWRRLLKLLPAVSDFHQGIQAALQDTENKAAQASGLGDRAKLQAPPTKGFPH
jgi:cytochrome c-type biogenesis protein CcmH